MTHQPSTPAAASGEGSELVIWSDHHHMVVFRHSSDGTPKIDVLERLPLESESDFDARTATYVRGRNSRVSFGPPTRPPSMSHRV